MKITFAGAAGGNVTGTRHLVHAAGKKILFDCGLVQGHRADSDRANRNFLFNPSEIDAVVLSHGHIDHSGDLPRLVAAGFAGPIWTTPATRDLIEPMLLDSAFLQAHDAEFWNKHHPHDQISPIYDESDVRAALARVRPLPYDDPHEIFPGVRVTLRDAGHVLGSAGILLEADSKKLYFTGDLGRPGLPILRDPAPVPAGLDALITESTYGDRLHADFKNASENLASHIRRVAARGGKILIPTFALERTQELLFLFNELIEEGRIPRLPVVVDSPLASKLTQVFHAHPELFDEKMRDRMARDRDGDALSFVNLEFTGSVEESMALRRRHGPMVILSASGMCEGGRILHHLKNHGGDHRNLILFVGYQAEGTLGRRILEGSHSMKIYGVEYRRRAEIASMDAFSAHADFGEILRWLRPAGRQKKIFVVHGENGPRDALRGHLIAEGLAHDIALPGLGETVEV